MAKTLTLDEFNAEAAKHECVRVHYENCVLVHKVIEIRKGQPAGIHPVTGKQCVYSQNGYKTLSWEDDGSKMPEFKSVPVGCFQAL